MILSPTEMCDKSLPLVGIDPQQRWSKEKRSLNFKEHYGSTPLSLAHVWYDITVFDFDASLKLKDFEKEQRGFMMFMVANFYVWTYPKNTGLIAAHFDIGKYYCQGRPLWIWIEQVAALRAKKIVWISELDDPNAECFVVTIDGTDFKTWEKKTSYLKYGYRAIYKEARSRRLEISGRNFYVSSKSCAYLWALSRRSW
jgi:hypothetical protein